LTHLLDGWVALESTATAGSHDAVRRLDDLASTRLGPEQVVVDGLSRSAWGDPELVAKDLAQPGVDVEGFGNVALTGQRAPEHLIPALPKRGQADQVAASPYCCGQLGAADSRCCDCVGFQSPNPDVCQMLALLADPRCIFSGQKLALGDEHCYQRRTPGVFPATERDLRLGPMRGLRGDLHIDAGVLPKLQAQGCPAVGDSRSENPAQLGDQGVEPGLGGGRELSWPDGPSQLVATGEPVAVEDQVSEQEPALAPWKATIEALTVPLDDRRPAEMDPDGRLSS